VLAWVLRFRGPPIIQVLNKVDLVPAQDLAHLSSDREAIPVSSLQHTGLDASKGTSSFYEPADQLLFLTGTGVSV